MILYAAISAVLIVLARAVLPGRYSPGHAWAYAWAFAWASQALVGAGFVLSTATALFVAACNIVFVLGAFLASRGRRRTGEPADPAAKLAGLSASSKTRMTIGAFAVITGFIFLHAGLRQIGHPGVLSIFGGSYAAFADSLRVTKSSFSVGGVSVTPVSITISTTLLTAAAVLAGVEAALLKRRAWKAPASFALSVGAFAFITSASTGIRSYLLVSALIFVGAYLATKIAVEGETFRVGARTYLAAAVAIAGFLGWVVLVQSARRKDFSLQAVGATLDYLRAWFAGYMPALSQWLNGTELVEPGLGTNLLRGVLGPLGLAKSDGFGEAIEAVSIGDGAMSNAMTVFRVLLLDFGYSGTLIVSCLAGFAAHRVYVRTIDGSVAWIALLGAVYAAVFYSFNYWFFGYGSRVAGVLLAGVILGACRRGLSGGRATVRTALAARNEAERYGPQR